MTGSHTPQEDVVDFFGLFRRKPAAGQSAQPASSARGNPPTPIGLLAKVENLVAHRIIRLEAMIDDVGLPQFR
jgi:hypothetical protein